MKHYYGMTMIIIVIYTFISHHYSNYLNYSYYRQMYFMLVIIQNFVAPLAQSGTRGSTPQHLLRPR